MWDKTGNAKKYMDIFIYRFVNMKSSSTIWNTILGGKHEKNCMFGALHVARDLCSLYTRTTRGSRGKDVHAEIGTRFYNGIDKA
jgi:hypothetical protein